MKTFFAGLLTLTATLGLFAAPQSDALKTLYQKGQVLEGMYRRPVSTGKGPEMLLLCGGRPWFANDFAKIFIQAGYRVNLLNGVYLAGLSGASIKITPDDPREPEPLDGITPEFDRLADYKIVFVNLITPENQKKLFTPERVEKLKKFVSAGGALVLTFHAPELPDELMPVGKTVSSDEMEMIEPGDYYAQRPAQKLFAALPERWKIYASFRNVALKKGAKTLSKITDPGNHPVGIYLAEKPFGKGKVIYWNAEFNRLAQSRQLCNWAYARRLVAAVAALGATDANIDLDKTLKKHTPELTPKMISRAEVELKTPTFQMKETPVRVELKDHTFYFSNGYKIVVHDNKVDVFYPGAKKAYIRNMRLPWVSFPKKADKVDSLTAEAVAVKRSARRSTAIWKVAKLSGGNAATIEVAASDGSAYRWKFVTGRAEIDGRVFDGIGQQITLTKLPDHLLSEISVTYQVDVGNQRFRRFACYTLPRGYVEYDMTGKADADTGGWEFFGNGQPFTYLEGKEAVFAEFVDRVQSTSCEYRASQGSEFARGKMIFRFGRVKAPQTTPVLWQMTADAKYNQNDDWMAMYQFQRKMLRAKEGFPETFARPVAGHRNTCSDEEVEAVADFAAKAGYGFFRLTKVPTEMEQFAEDHVLEYLGVPKKYGMKGYTWFACCHSPGDSPTVLEHPEWYLKDEKGNLATYFDHFRIGDVNHPEFVKWHLGVVDGMFQQGLGSVWYDMGGAAASGVNFGTPESPIALTGQMKIFRKHFDFGGWVVTEGMNPCVVDGYIFRENDYHDPVGNEFAMLGAQIDAAGFRCDHFRLAMYDIFTPLFLDGKVFDFDDFVGAQKLIDEELAFVKPVNELLEGGMPYIRETPFGTSWISDKTAAFFFWDGVKEFSAKVPEGYKAYSLTAQGKTEMLNGVLPESVAPKTLIILKKVLEK